MNNRGIKIILRIYEYALIAHVLFFFGSVKTSALFFMAIVSSIIFIIHWLLPEIGKRILFAVLSGFLSWFFWINVLGWLVYAIDVRGHEDEHSPWDLVIIFLPVILALGFGTWALIKRQSLRVNDRVYLALVGLAFTIAYLLD